MAFTERHPHPTFKTGRLPKDPARLRLRLASVLRAQALQASAVPASTSFVDAYPVHYQLHHNDEFGTCGPTALDNYGRLVSLALTGTEHGATDEQVFDLYRQSGNPDFDPSTGAGDGGVVLQDMLEQANKHGLGDMQVVAFLEVDHTNPDELDVAQALFGGVLQGVNLEVAQQSETDQGQAWDYVRSGEWGGHAVPALAYNKANPGNVRRRVVSWKMVVGETSAFLDQQLDEAWVVVTQWHLQSKEFLAGVNVDALAAYYKQRTGRDMPGYTPAPAPAPAPAPTPEPVPAPPAPKPPAPGGTIPTAEVAKLLHAIAKDLAAVVHEIEKVVKGL